MKLMINIKELLTGLYLSLKRFPWVTSFSTATTIVLIMIVNYQSIYNNNTIDVLKRTAMCLSLGIPLFLFINLLFERISIYSKIGKITTQLGGIILLLLYYFLLLDEINMVSITRFIALNLTFYLISLITQYVYNRDNFELYVVHLFSRFFVTVIYSFVLFSGLVATLFTIDKLLGIKVQEELYFTTWLVVIGIFAPVFFLSGVPGYRKKFHLTDYPGFLKILLLYIVMPLISVYTIILYLYFTKILVAWQWPQGLVAHLVIWYSVITIIVMFFTSPIKKQSDWAIFFIFWFPKIILPLLAMMFFAIWIRINTYGVTENRFFVVLLGLWVSGIMIYYNLARRKRNIILPLSLAIITVLSVFGPWSAFSISINSQNKRFEEILLRNDMIKGEKIIKPETSVTKDDQKEISAIIGYFKNNHSLQDLEYLPSDFTINKMEDIFGFKYHPERHINYRHFIHNLYKDYRPVKISGYDYFFEIASNRPITPDKDINNSFRYDGRDLQVRLDDESLVLEIFHREKKICSKPLKEDLLRIYKKIEKNEITKIPPEDYTIIDENRDINLKILVKKIGGGIDKSNEKNIIFHSLDFYVFIKLKS